MIKTRLIATMFVVAALLLVGCDDKKVYDQYLQTPLNGWEKNDVLCFTTKPLDAGNYALTLNVRIDNDYPFTQLALVINRDTFSCAIADNEGQMLGSGINIYHYAYTIDTLKVNHGDSLTFTIHHCMKREILPGIIDIGLILRKE